MSTNEHLSRFRFHFEKNENMKYTGHLDLHRTLERTFRRSNMPLAYSQGFNPHPRMTLAITLPLGCTSSHEIVDFWLNEPLPIDEVASRLKKGLPPGITFVSIEEISIQAPKPQKAVQSAWFTVSLKETDTTIQEKVDTFMASEEVIIDKKRKGKMKKVNIRPFVLEMKANENAKDIEMNLTALPSATGRPDDVMKSLGYAINKINIHRTKIILNEEQV